MLRKYQHIFFYSDPFFLDTVKYVNVNCMNFHLPCLCSYSLFEYVSMYWPNITQNCYHTVLKRDMQCYMHLRQWQAIAFLTLKIRENVRKSRLHYKISKTRATNGQR